MSKSAVACDTVCVCPSSQGRFRINLSGTGLKVADHTTWTSEGNYVVADIQKSQVSALCLIRSLGLNSKVLEVSRKQHIWLNVPPYKYLMLLFLLFYLIRPPFPVAVDL